MGLTQSGLTTLETGLTLLVNVVALFGNMFIILAVYRNKKLRTTTNLFILNLGLADGLTALVCIPLTLSAIVSDRWPAGIILCRVQGFLMFALGSVSIHTVTLTALNRYCRILQATFYRKWMTYKATLIFIGSMWLVLFCSVGAAVLSGSADISYRPGAASCILRFSHSPIGRAALGLTVVFGFLYPTVTIVFCYLKVFQTVRQHNLQMETLHRGTLRARYRPRSQTQTRFLSRQVSLKSEESNDRRLTRAAGNYVEPMVLPETERSIVKDNIMDEVCSERDGNLIFETENQTIQQSKLVDDHILSLEELRQKSDSLVPIMKTERLRSGHLESATTHSARVTSCPATNQKTETPKRRQFESMTRNGSESSKANQAPSLGPNVDEIRVTRILFIVLMGYAVCWFPAAVISLLTYTPRGRNLPEFVRFLSVWVFYLSSCLNVFIYGIMSKPFRSEFRGIICCS